MLTVVILFSMQVASYGKPVRQRTREVRQAIVAAVPGVNDANDVTDAHLAEIIRLNLNSKDIKGLKAGDFDGLTGLKVLRLNDNQLPSLPDGIFQGLTALRTLNLYDNQLSSLPVGLFEGLTSLKTLRLGKNSLNPFPLSVSLVKVAEGQFKAVAPTGATFNYVLPISITDGTIVGGATTLTIPQGRTESETLTVTRAPNAASDVTATIGTLPTPPAGHFDYELVRSADLPLVIIDEIENSSPVFTEGTSTSRSVAENTASGENIGNPVAATDADSSDTLEYTLGGTDAAAFDIVSSSGQLQTKATLDYETKSSYSVTVSVSDGNGGTHTITVTINVTDVLDQDDPLYGRTQQVQDAIVARVGVNRAADVTAAHLTTITGLYLNNKSINALKLGDFDGLTNLTGLYLNNNSISDISTLSEVPNLRYLVLHDNSISNISALSETTNLIYLDLHNNSISDLSALSGLTNLTSLMLSGNSISDYGPLRTLIAAIEAAGGSLNLDINIPPEFTEGPSTLREVAENAGAGQNVGDPVAAIDANSNDTLRYSLDGTDADLFDIDSISGQLTLTANDYDEEASYSVTVSVSDSNGGTDTIDVTITVTDVNENNAPAFTDGTSTSREVAENTASGENIGNPIAATDPDTGDTLTYTLGGTDAASFDIVGSSGQLQTKAPLDYETKSSYSVTVSVSDGNGVIESITVTINITDVNESPIFADGSRTTRSVPENTPVGANIGSTISASDPENDRLTYSLGGTDGESFDIAPTSGQLQTKDALDYETQDSYAVEITASDGNLTETIAVTITITDANDAPAFQGSSATRTIAENTPAGVNIGDPVTATDPDSSDTLIYILDGTDAFSFDIVSTSGQLQTKEALDYETKSSYVVTVFVSDNKGGADSIDVTITVTDVDDNRPPAFYRGRRPRSIAENTGPGVNIGNPVAATDPDTGDTLTYTLGGTDAAAFDIVSTSGQLLTKAPLDYETKASYSVTVSVSDGKGGSDITTVNIEVTDALEEFYPLMGRTQQVQDAIVAAVDGVDSAADVTRAHLASIEVLYLDNQSITTLKSHDFDELINMSVLILDGNSISELYPLLGLTSLRFLSLHRNSLTDVSALSGLWNLTSLLLDGNSISDISPLSGLTNLIELQLDGNSISDISALSGLTNMISLNLSNNAIGDISDLSGLTNLTTLNLSNNAIGDISALSGLTNLTTLNLPNNAIGDISALSGLTNLTTLNLSNNSVGEISVLSGMTNLTFLDLSNNPISDISALSGLTNLETLTLSGNPISDYDPLRTLIAAIVAAGRSLDLDITIPPVKRNNNAPIFTDGTSTSRAIAENTVSGENIGNPIAATDADSDDTLAYTLGGVDASAFDIIGSSGQLQTRAPLDYETKSSYSVTVFVSDNRGGSDSITVAINVTDVSDQHGPLDGRTQQVQEAIVEVVDGVDTAADVTAAHLAAITELYLSYRSITSLEADDFDGLTNLVFLDLFGNSLSDISALSGLTNLTHLSLAGNSLNDISALSGLTNLVEISLSGNPLSDISALSTLTNLTHLYMEYTSVSNISALSGLTKLIKLQLNNTSISDISALSRLTKLTYLDLADTEISDISALSGMTKMTNLNLSNNSIDDISALSGMTEMTNLNLYRNSISDISPLSELKSLLYLNLNRNSVSDVSPLSGLTNLIQLGLWRNSITDFGPLNILIEAIRADGRELDINIQITGAIRNNNRPVFTEGRSTLRSVAENTPSGENIGDPVEATDGNGDTLTYTLVGPDAESFDLDRSSGQLLTKAPLDYETKASYSVIISVSDSKRYGSDRSNVTINVTDVDEVAAAPTTDSVQPPTSALLPNYPNPFNPETWIPYQLAKPADVTLTIYDIKGHVVRTLALGHQRAGIYQNRSRAAYWDGRNAFGEPVASGLYFYTLTAGDFTATRKMLIRK